MIADQSLQLTATSTNALTSLTNDAQFLDALSYLFITVAGFTSPADNRDVRHLWGGGGGAWLTPIAGRRWEATVSLSNSHGTCDGKQISHCYTHSHTYMHILKHIHTGLHIHTHTHHIHANPNNSNENQDLRS